MKFKNLDTADCHAVQTYMHKTCKTIGEVTKAFIDGEDVVKQSGYFRKEEGLR